MTDVRFDFTGIDRGLKRLEDAVATDVLERVATKSAEPMEKRMRGGAPFRRIRRAIDTRTLEKRRRRVVVGTGAFGRSFAAIYEFGTKLRKTKGGQRRGRIRPQPFLRPAFDGQVGRWFHEVGRRLFREIQRYAGR